MLWCNGLTPTEARKKKVMFSDIYYEAIQTILIHSKNKEQVATIEDLRGKKVGIQKDSIQRMLIFTQLSLQLFQIN